MFFDLDKIIKNFPILNKKYDFGRLIYLDNAATSHKPEMVINGIKDFYENYNANVHRSVHDLAEKATSFYEQSREKVAKFINADSDEIVFTSGTTDGTNFVSAAWALNNVSNGDEIVLTQVEHHANLLPWQRVAHKKGAILKFIKLDKQNFVLDLSDIDQLITEKTKLVAITHSSNVLGDVWGGNLEKVIKRAKSVGAKVLLDCAQTAGRKKIDVKKLDVDFIVFSGHKMLAPTGIGVLFIKKDLHNDVEPYKVGGSMVYSVSFDDAKWAQPPQKFEAGTPPIAQAYGLSLAIDYLNKIDFDALEKHEALLSAELIDGLEKIEDVIIWGNKSIIKKSGHLISFSVKNIHAHDIAYAFSKKGISVRAGHHCAQPLANLLGINASVRASFYLYNTVQDVKGLLDVLNEIIKNLKV